MARTLSSPEYILPLRFTLRIPDETPARFSVLNFPYAKALKAFMERFKGIYGKELPWELQLPYRQLNDALLTLAPGLIQGFENAKEGNEATRRMVAFTQYKDGHAEAFPRLDQLTVLIRNWLERWAAQQEVRAIVRGEGKAAWQTMLNALNANPETDWEHESIAPANLANNPAQKSALGYLILPALLTALLHERKMTVERPLSQGNLEITWRRANEGGSRGLHLVSQTIPYRDDYFAYRLDFSVQTQAGHEGSWIFASLGIQRYIGERYRNDPTKRATSILVGHNRERFTGGWDTNTTLIRLPVERKGSAWVWESGVGGLLDDFAVRRLEQPETVLNAPLRYGDYDNHKPQGDEYYIVYAEGRTFGDKRGRGHQIKTGVSLRERSQLMEGVLNLLDGWLEVSPSFRKDAQNPANTMALRDYDYMTNDDRKDNTTQQASWRAALETSLANNDSTHAHLVLLYQSQEFCKRAQIQIAEALMGVDSGMATLVTVTYKPLPPLLYAPLSPGDLDPKTYFLPREQKPPGWMETWRRQMRDSYCKKRDEWRTFLEGLGWQSNALRLLLIDSTGESDPDTPDDQKIKGAVRDACHRENILSQFIVGETLKLDKRETHKDELDGGSAGRLKNAVLDLLVRQQGILYASPHEIYERAAHLDAETANQLDIIAFCRVQRTKFPKLYYVLAVRLRASGEVDVMLPGVTTSWTPYTIAAHTLGIIYSEQRPSLANDRPSPLRLGHQQMLNFVHDVLTKCLERPTLAVIEAEGWRNSRGWDEQNYCWAQLTNPNLFKDRDKLSFDKHRCYERAAPMLNSLLGVVRLRMDDETPEYVTAENWRAEAPLRDIPHLTGYIDPQIPELLHYLSIARLPELQKKQKEKPVMEAFRSDVRTNPKHDIAMKHAQIIEMVPFFVHQRYQNDEGKRQLCRCVHFLRHSPAFTMGEIALPYPMHLGEKLIRDQMVIIGADD